MGVELMAIGNYEKEKDFLEAMHFGAETKNKKEIASAKESILTLQTGKADLVNGKVPEEQLPSYVDDVIEVEDFEHLPTTGESGKIYVTIDNGNSYRWSGTTYVLVSTPDAVSYKPQSGRTDAEKTQARENIGAASKEAINTLAEQVKGISSINKYLSDWDCTTGLPTTNPLDIQLPYTYNTGDIYIVKKVAEEGGTNYKPSGSQYDETPSTDVETDTVNMGDIYRYDGIRWSIYNLAELLSAYLKKSEVESRTEVIEYLDGTTETVKPLYEAEG